MAPEVQTVSSCSAMSDMFSLGLLIVSIYNNGRSLMEANLSTSQYCKQLEAVCFLIIISHQLPYDSLFIIIFLTFNWFKPLFKPIFIENIFHLLSKSVFKNNFKTNLVFVHKNENNCRIEGLFPKPHIFLLFHWIHSLVYFDKTLTQSKHL